MTGVSGGLLRDLICRQAPLVLHQDLYASVALVVAALYLALLHFGFNEIATVSSLIVGYVMRMASVRFKWRLPTFCLIDNSDNNSESTVKH